MLHRFKIQDSRFKIQNGLFDNPPPPRTITKHNYFQLHGVHVANQVTCQEICV